jgi:hypothetical protein
MVLGFAAFGGCSEKRPDPVEDLEAVEQVYRGLRDAILHEDDEAFFLLHSRSARETAVAEFPQIRARFLASSKEEQVEFLETYRVTREEFLGNDARSLVIRLLPWRSGWRERRELFRTVSVKDVRIEHIAARGEEPASVQAVLYLDIPKEMLPDPSRPLETRFLPTVIFVRDEDGWRRRAFF